MVAVARIRAAASASRFDEETSLPLPEALGRRRWRELLSGADAGGRAAGSSRAALFAHLPVAVLVLRASSA